MGLAGTLGNDGRRARFSRPVSTREGLKARGRMSLSQTLGQALPSPVLDGKGQPSAKQPKNAQHHCPSLHTVTEGGAAPFSDGDG